MANEVPIKVYVDQRFSDQEKAVQAALVAVKEENGKSERAAEKRFDLLNELRVGVATKEQLEALEKVVDDLKDRINTGQGKSLGYGVSWGIFLGVSTLFVAVIGVVIVIIFSLLHK